MTYVAKIIKYSSTENVEENNGKTKGVMYAGISQNWSQSLKQINQQSNPTLFTFIEVIRPKASESLDGRNLTNVGIREYSCKYCPKKFGSKQALGGHQNAHKKERATERQLRQGQIANFGYVTDPSNAGLTSLPFPDSFIQSPNSFGWSLTYSQHYSQWPQPKQHEMHANYYKGFMPTMSHESWDARFLQELSTSPTLTGSHFMSYRSRIGWRENVWKGSTSASTKNDQAECSRRNNDSESQKLEDAGLDLTLKL